MCCFLLSAPSPHPGLDRSALLWLCHGSRHISAGLAGGKQNTESEKRMKLKRMGLRQPQTSTPPALDPPVTPIPRSLLTERRQRTVKLSPFISHTRDNHTVPRPPSLLWSVRCFGAVLPTPTGCHGACCSDSSLDRAADCLHGNKKNLWRKDAGLGNILTGTLLGNKLL